MRDINRIFIHCSATPEGRPVTIEDIDRWHRDRGFNKVGYHWVVDLEGTAHKGRDVWEVGAHVRGHNKDSIGICYVGGMDADNDRPKDTRTVSQIITMDQLIDQIRADHGHGITVHGHNEVAAKACPSFNVRWDRWQRRR